MEKNLQSEQALEKFTKLVKDVNICMFITANRNDAETHTRPMATVDVEENEMKKKAAGVNTTKLGPEMTDGEFRKFCGL